VPGGPLLHPTGKNKSVGTISFGKVSVTRAHTFLDYINGDCEVSLMTAIDFTASNGDPKGSTSLHYIDTQSGQLNPYQQALFSVGNIVSAYDHDGMIPGFGFGAQFPNGQVSHCFNLNGAVTPQCRGIDDLEHHYRQVLLNTKLWGPTNFALIINNVAAEARSSNVSQQKQMYFTLLILVRPMPSCLTRLIACATVLVLYTYLSLSVSRGWLQQSIAVQLNAQSSHQCTRALVLAGMNTPRQTARSPTFRPQ
jgi:hypothetical protein